MPNNQSTPSSPLRHQRHTTQSVTSQSSQNNDIIAPIVTSSSMETIVTSQSRSRECTPTADETNSGIYSIVFNYYSLSSLFDIFCV